MNNDLIIGGKPYTIQYGAIRTLSLRRELIDEILDPESEIEEIRMCDVGADLLTFIQRPLAASQKFPYFMEWDNFAALEISSYEHWLMKQIPQQTRNKVRKAEKKGVIVRVEPFSDRLIEGLVGIFNESPVRQGRSNLYYGWDFQKVRGVWARDLDRSVWIVAWHDGEMIGFIKLIVGNDIAKTSGTIAKIAHRDKGAMNAVLAKSVDVCAEKGIPTLVYGHYIYGRKGEDSLTEFKINNGFKRYDIPRWYVPLSMRGRVGLSVGLHKELVDFIPGPLCRLIRKIKAK